MNMLCSDERRKLKIGALLLFVIGIFHRVLQLWLLWPLLRITITGTPDAYAMQLLPKDIMVQHPWWGLWFLQQSPPLPNLIWAGILLITQSPHYLAVITILFQAILSSATAAALAILFTRLGVKWWLGLLLSLCFLLSSNLMLLEYNPYGYLYYEMMTMLFVVLACHAGLSVQQTKRSRDFLMLGLCVAALALTRATFSYFWPVVLLWLSLLGYWRKPRLLMFFLLPIFILHGGWSLKNYVAHGYFSWGTSSWGGVNMHQGERIRNGFQFNRWVAQQAPICASPWHEFTASDPIYLAFMPDQWHIQIPANIAAQDNLITEKRGAYAIMDSVAAREWSQCLQKEFARYWLSHPMLLLEGAWRSYQVFWQPIRQFQVIRPFPFQIEMQFYGEGVHLGLAVRDALKEFRSNYLIRITSLRLDLPKPSDYAPAKVIALPFFASFIAVCSFILLHSLPVLFVCAKLRRRELFIPAGASLMLLFYCYDAGLSNVVEYPENMRFRIEVEPIIWCICAIALMNWVAIFRKSAPISSV